MSRLDKFLVEKKFVETRTKAQELIAGGFVLVNGKEQTKSSFLVKEADLINIKENDVLKYVSRGGLKLEKALKVFNVDLTDKIVLDIGSSTGGFTDCSLQNGAKKVIAIDVGTDVMHHSLRNNPQVELHENTNFLNFKNEKMEEVDFAVCDVSFVSLEHVVKKLNSANVKLEMICLIKPQFECGKQIATKYSGVIKSKTIHKDVLNKVLKFFNKNNFYLLGLDFSPIKGGDGNIEYITHFSNKTDKNTMIDIEKIINSAFKM